MEIQKLKKYRVTKNAVNNSLYFYLRKYYYYEGNDWINPTSGEVFSKSDIKKALDIIKGLNPLGYKVLWSLYTTGGTKSSISRRHQMSLGRYKILAERTIDTLVLIVHHPELVPDEPVALYD